MKEKKSINQTSLKLKSSFYNGNVKSIRGQNTVQEEIISENSSDKEVLSKIYEELLKLNNNKPNKADLKMMSLRL